VYALGRLGYDFGSEARRDWFRSQMRYAGPGGRDLDPYVPSDLEAFFQGSPATEDQVARVGHPEAAEAVIWTLNFDATAIYAIHPVGPFARDVYQLLRQFLKEQQPIGVEGGQGAERLAVPGLIAGKVRLFSGQVVPVIQPDPRGLLNWTTGALTETVIEALSGIAGVNPRAEIANFLSRVLRIPQPGNHVARTRPELCRYRGAVIRRLDPIRTVAGLPARHDRRPTECRLPA
jgi:hypothetical protein